MEARTPHGRALLQKSIEQYRLSAAAVSSQTNKGFMTTISICMIAKNETECLARALANWRVLADEVIVVDTGSTDDTVVMATMLGAQVLTYDWQYPGHRGEARNVGLDAAHGDWIVVLDADEIISAPKALRAAIIELNTHFDGLDVVFHNYNAQGDVILKWHQLRVFRRGTYRYKHRVHELPHPLFPGAKLGLLDIVFEHRPPTGREESKRKPLLDGLLLDVAEHPGDPHPLYYLHNQYVRNGDFNKGIEYGQKFLLIPGEYDRCMCYGNMSYAHMMLGEMETAIRYLHIAATEQPDRRIWWIRLAELYYNTRRYNLALAMLRCAETLIPTTYEQLGEPVTYTTYMHELIQRCQAAQERVTKQPIAIIA